uniref:Uncharacterized protein n=1 Tax=Arundo donax TaxID=35708 RepID=A0A0A8Y4W7_ARUDO
MILISHICPLHIHVYLIMSIVLCKTMECVVFVYYSNLGAFILVLQLLIHYACTTEIASSVLVTKTTAKLKHYISTICPPCLRKHFLSWSSHYCASEFRSNILSLYY